MLNVSDLENTIQGLRVLRPASARRVDWTALERSLGVGLPTDFKEFAEAYPAVEIDEFLRVWSPTPGREEEFIEVVQYCLEMLRDLQEAGDTEHYAAYPEPEGLLPWGESLEGDVFYWRTTGPDPERWPVVASGRNGAWWECAGGMLAFLVGVVDGTGERSELPDGVLGPNASVLLLDT
ncbi:SMI1/KNR4 family protein [Streptomyces gilvus]|uniref:SMI1/KNR4 family protein n=1 Tax=Streptomyces gilvus TaxID=2920937 RepID=UPI001F0D9727|nr:SMI1/KNR4 family protein [Streptomyces sp. CME 23]MCH5672359.1 SMI1/KNR4 family protein [Streptomyces sp. CME 23]